MIDMATATPQYQYYLKDHLGNTRVVVNSDTTAQQITNYYAFGLTSQSYQSGTSNKYLYNGKELQDDLIAGRTLDWYDYGARMYDAELGRFMTVDPLAETFSYQSSYVYADNDPIKNIDFMGMNASTHTDSIGNVLAVYSDGDLGVYKHNDAKSKKDVDKKRKETKSNSGGGEKMGETEHIDEFVNPETGYVMTGTQILFDQTWDGIIESSAAKAYGMNLMEIAANSDKKKIFDVKHFYPNQGRLLNGKYASSRSAGNYLAGYNSAVGKLYGVGISFDTFQKLAGALHVKNAAGQKLSKLEMVDIVTQGFQYGPAPAYGEQMYQYRMSRKGWTDRIGK